MALIPFGDFRPDVSPYRGKHTTSATNVLPQGDGYGPLQSLLAYTNALPAQCRGAFVAYALDGTVEVFAGTSTNLYRLNKTNLTWTEASKSTDAYSLPTDAQWSFAQLGNVVIAAHINDVLQVFTIGSSTDFADQSGSPQAQQITIINEFVVASGISGNLNRVKWSARADVTVWTVGTAESDQEDFLDGGIVKRVEGGEFSGLVLQDRAIHRMTYQPGAPTIFAFDRIKKIGGLRVQGMVASDDERTFYLSHRGFQMLPAGANSTVPIGKEKVDRFFFADWDTSETRTALATIDPQGHRVFFAYFSINGETTKFDRLLVYDWVLERWAYINGIVGQYLFPFAAPGTTLEALDAQFPDIDAMTLSLDDIPLAQSPEIGVVGADSKAGFLRGDTLEAELQTAEQSGEFDRLNVDGFRPVTDASDVRGRVSFRGKLADDLSWTEEATMDADGFVAVRKNTRMTRFRCRIPAATSWSFALGIETQAIKAGRQ